MGKAFNPREDRAHLSSRHEREIVLPKHRRRRIQRRACPRRGARDREWISAGAEGVTRHFAKDAKRSLQRTTQAAGIGCHVVPGSPDEPVQGSRHGVLSRNLKDILRSWVLRGPYTRGIRGSIRGLALGWLA